MKDKPITSIFEHGIPDLDEFDKLEIPYQEWYIQDEPEIRIPLDELNERQLNLVLSYCSGSTIEYIQKEKPDYVIFWK